MQGALPRHTPPPPKRLLLVPKAPVLVADGQGFTCLTAEGEIRQLDAAAAKQLVAQSVPIVCHAAHIARHLRVDRFDAYDVLELFAFIHPGRFTVPTPRGMARSLNLLEPDSPAEQCMALRDAIRHLLADLAAAAPEDKGNPAAIAAMMGLMMGSDKPDDANAGWPWTSVVLAALGRAETPPLRGEIRAGLRLWERLPEWAQHAPEPPAGHAAVSAGDAAGQLKDFIRRQKRDDRPQQESYAAALAAAFQPRNDADAPPHVVLAEAGTGVGKTLGYLAPATSWAQKNGGAVWVSTYTRNLQRQVDDELARIYDDPSEKSRRVVTRKGRENYLCLLNLEDVTQAPGILTHDLNATALGLMLRWAGVTADGDLTGKDFPGWLADILGPRRLYAFADRRGECIYSACPHFDKCFVEKSVRKAKRADIVIANHALVMNQTGAAGNDDILPARYVFDEGHHIFDAADSAFALHLDGTETADLRRWLMGQESAGGRKTRVRGLKRRLEDIAAGDDGMARDIEAVIEAARALPAPQWRQRLAAGTPAGAAETFLMHCARQVQARCKDAQSGYSLETDTRPALPELAAAASALKAQLENLQRPMLSLVKRLQQRLIDDADTLSVEMKERIRFAAGSLHRRASPLVGGWAEMLGAIAAPAPADGLVDWLEITRAEGRDIDVGFYCHALDPAASFAGALRPHADGVVMTSATLRDIGDDDADGWKSPRRRTGADTLSPVPQSSAFPSPFDYAVQTRIIVLKDIDKNSTDETAAALRALFAAAGGGALGIFTAVQRLRAVESKIRAPLQTLGLPLFAQHVDPLDTGTLIDIFREEENACLLGTDATRDGVDVPGRSLRLVAYDRVPWPRPTILHKARRAHFGRGYDDMLTRFKIKQAYGRLIRQRDDKGVFVMLDSAMPSRLATAFPDGVEIHRIGLSDAVAMVAAFLKENTA